MGGGEHPLVHGRRVSVGARVTLRLLTARRSCRVFPPRSALPPLLDSDEVSARGGRRASIAAVKCGGFFYLAAAKRDKSLQRFFFRGEGEKDAHDQQILECVPSSQSEEHGRHPPAGGAKA